MELSVLFERLRAAGYAWSPLSPERLQALRREPGELGPLERRFGLGLPADARELEAAGIPAELPPELGVCSAGEHYVAHELWGIADPLEVYASEESLKLAAWAAESPKLGEGAPRVLELGSGAGAVAFLLSGRARRVLGLEPAARAVVWPRAAARAQGLGDRVELVHARIGEPAADAALGPERWDLAVFNAPMTIPVPGQPREYRDGGRLGLEVPLAFLEFARGALAADGQAAFLATNPIVAGRDVFFEELARRPWRVLARERLHPRFNQALYRKERYAERFGIERVELWAVRLAKG
jgi:tRNA1(Val) A37 N6-methylase TrmN6